MLDLARCCRSVRIVLAALLAVVVLSTGAKAQSGVGACCKSGGQCFTSLDYDGCTRNGGSFMDGQSCSSCSQNGACCVGTTCTVATPGNCAGASGFYLAGSCTANPCPSPVLAGSCCSSSGDCTTILQAGCAGTWSAGAACNAAPCIPKGACCFNTACVFVVKADCAAAWYPNTSCAAANCGPKGACCNPATGVCFDTTAANCPGSSTFISGSTCAMAPCQPSGACCNRANTCVAATQDECASLGGFFTPNITCTPDPCNGPLGACCIPGQAGGCAFITKGDCPFGSVFTANAPCNPDPCPNTQGACCNADGCSITIANGCAGTFYPAQPCATNLCPPVGACCNTVFGGCAQTSLAACAGMWYAAVSCSPSPCATTGSCCSITNLCSLSTLASCTGTWYASASCLPSPCPKGGCCNEVKGICVINTVYACQQSGLSFMGVGIVCAPASCVVTTGACCDANGGCSMTTQTQCASKLVANATCKPNPCCFADFSGNNALEVSDVFEFIGTWFAGCP